MADSHERAPLVLLAGSLAGSFIFNSTFTVFFFLLFWFWFFFFFLSIIKSVVVQVLPGRINSAWLLEGECNTLPQHKSATLSLAMSCGTEL